MAVTTKTVWNALLRSLPADTAAWAVEHQDAIMAMFGAELERARAERKPVSRSKHADAASKRIALVGGGKIVYTIEDHDGGLTLVSPAHWKRMALPDTTSDSTRQTFERAQLDAMLAKLSYRDRVEWSAWVRKELLTRPVPSADSIAYLERKHNITAPYPSKYNFDRDIGGNR